MQIDQGDSLKTIAETIGDKTFTLSLDAKYMSPFTRRGGWRFGFYGGKSDDITLVVSIIREKSTLGDLTDQIRHSWIDDPEGEVPQSKL